MKHSLLLTCFSAFAAVTGLTNAQEQPQTAPEAPVVTLSVADTLKGNLQILKDDKFVPAEVNPNTEYYVVYYTASW